MERLREKSTDELFAELTDDNKRIALEYIAQLRESQGEDV